MTVTTAPSIRLAQRDQWRKPSSSPLFWGCQGLLPGLPPGTRTLEPRRVCTARTKVKEVMREELPQPCVSQEGDAPLLNAGLWPSCPSLSALLLTGQGAHLAGRGCTATWSFCQASLASVFPGQPWALSLQKHLGEE